MILDTLPTSEYLGILIALLICFVGVPGIVMAFVVPFLVHHHKYASFIEQYSSAYRKVKYINSRYKFATLSDYDMWHTYDNNDFYPTVSCQDYLTYQLVKMDKEIVKALNDADDNRFKYKMYSEEIKKCCYEQYKSDTSNYNLATLNRFEKRMVKSIIKKPHMTFTMTVTLRRTDIGGNYKEKKRQTFNEHAVEDILMRIHEKHGNRYLDEDIWRSIVRVERAKVSNKLRFAVFSRDNNRCVKCGSRRNLEVDHVYPISKGGKTVMNNLQTLCHRCNVKKGNSVE